MKLKTCWYWCCWSYSDDSLPSFDSGRDWCSLRIAVSVFNTTCLGYCPVNVLYTTNVKRRKNPSFIIFLFIPDRDYYHNHYFLLFQTGMGHSEEGCCSRRLCPTLLNTGLPFSFRFWTGGSFKTWNNQMISWHNGLRNVFVPICLTLRCAISSCFLRLLTLRHF